MAEIIRGREVARQKFLSIGPGGCKLPGSTRVMILRRSFAAFYALLFVALTLFAGMFFLQTFGEYTALSNQNEEYRTRLADLDLRLVEQQRTLERLRNDPAFVERAIRERLLYARPDEIVFRFER